MKNDNKIQLSLYLGDFLMFLFVGIKDLYNNIKRK